MATKQLAAVCAREKVADAKGRKAPQQKLRASSVAFPGVSTFSSVWRKGDNTMTIPSTQSIHTYDHDSRRLFLENGQVVKIKGMPDIDVDSAVERVQKFALSNRMIGHDDLVVHFQPAPMGLQESAAA